MVVVFLKYLLSFFKKNWELDDYPIEVYRNKNAGEKSVAYGAKITNWFGMVGHGETQISAIETLRNKFIIYKSNNKKIPRPGTKVPLKFASTVKIKLYEDVAVDFLNKIFHTDYYNGFYSDESCMQYLELMIEDKIEKPNEFIIQKVKDQYDTDITKIYDKPLWVILKAIKERATCI